MNLVDVEVSDTEITLFYEHIVYYGEIYIAEIYKINDKEPYCVELYRQFGDKLELVSTVCYSNKVNTDLGKYGYYYSEY